MARRAADGSRPAARRDASGPGLAALRSGFETYFRATLAANACPPGTLGRAIRYAALSPGKRLRPLLALAACEAVGGVWRDALPAAAALESVHAFSLVHDDLPAMDDDDYRRGRLTTHKKFGEALGVLTGDALLAFAFEELTRLPIAKRDPARGLLAVRLLALASGGQALVRGQAEDIAAEGKRPTRARVESIHLAKTGALMSASLALGVLAGGADAATIEHVSDLGLELGLAFQIQDDLLNSKSSLRRLGKRAGTDRARGKATYPGAVGEARARETTLALLSSAAHGLTVLPRPRRLLALVGAFAQREA